MKNLYKPIHKRVCVILTLVLLSVALTGCTIPISFNMSSNSAITIPKTAFFPVRRYNGGDCAGYNCKYG